MFTSTLFAVSLCAVAVRAATPSDVSSCSSGSASKYMSLADFPPAQGYCSDNYPSPATVTVTSCASATAATYTGASKRDQENHPQWRGDHGHPPPPGQSSSAVLFKQLMDQPSSVISTFCSCIGSQPDIVTVQTTCDSNEYCESSTQTCKIERDCANPAACDGHSFCGKGASGNNLFCHMDTDDSGMGYCMDDGPPNLGCPEPYEDCSSNADCGGKRVCIYSCCRAEPFCVDVRDYQNEGSAKMARSVRRNLGLMNPFGT